MTSTESKVLRRTVNNTVFDKGKHRRIIVDLGGGKDPDLIRFRLEGLREATDATSIKTLFWTAFRRTTIRKWEEKNAERKAAGQRKLRKPNLPKHP